MNRFMFKVIILVLGLFPICSLFGQAAILALIFGDKVASEEFNIGLELGWNRSNYTNISNLKRKSALNFGISGNFKLSEEFFLSPTIFFVSKRAYKLEGLYLNSGNPLIDSEFQNVNGNGDLSYIDIPIIAWYQFNKWRIGIGPQVSFLNKSELTFKGDEGDFVQNVKNQTNNMDYGLMFGLSYELGKARKGKGIFIQARYYLGFNDVYNESLFSSTNSNNYFALHFSLPFITDELAKKKLQTAKK